MFGKLSINPDEKSDPIIVPVNQKSFNIGNSKECDLRIDFSSIPNLLCTVKQIGKNEAALKICSNSVTVKLNNKTVLGETKLSNEDVINAGPISLKWLYVDGSEQGSKSKRSAGLKKRNSEPVKQKKGAFAFSKRRTIGEMKNNETSKLKSSMKNSRFSLNKTHQKLKTSVKCMIKDLQSSSSKKKSTLSISINGDDSLPKSSTRRSLFSQSGETLNKSVEKQNGSIGHRKIPPTRSVRKQLEKALTLANVKLKTPRHSKNTYFKSLSERPSRLSKEEMNKLREELLSVSSPTNNRAETPLSSKKLKSRQVLLSKNLEKLNKSLSFRNRPSVNDSVEVLVDSNSFPASSILETPSSSVKGRSGRFSKSIDISGYIERGGSPLLPNTSTPLTVRQSKKKIVFGHSSPSLTAVQESEDGWMSVISPNAHSSSKSKRLSKTKQDISLLKSPSDANISKSVKIEISDSCLNLHYSSECITSNKKNKSVVLSTILDDNSKLVNIKDSPNSPLVLNMSRSKRSSDAIMIENNQTSTSKFQMSTSPKKRNADEYNSHGAEDLISPRNKRKKMLEKSEPDIFSPLLLNNSNGNISGRRNNLRSMNTPKSLGKINNIQNFKGKQNSDRKGKINERYSSKENTLITRERVSKSTPKKTPMKYLNESITQNISNINVVDETPLKTPSSVKSDNSMSDKREEIVSTSLNETNISKGSSGRNRTPKSLIGVRSVEKVNSAQSVTRSAKTTNEYRNIRRSKSIETPTRTSPSGKIVTSVQRRSKSLEKLKLEVSKTKSKTPISNKKVELNISESLQKSTGRRGSPRKGEVEAPSKSLTLIDNETPSILKKISNAASIGKSSKTNVKSLSKRRSGVEVALYESQLSSIGNTSTSTRKNKSLHSVGRRNTDRSKSVRRSKSIEVKTPSSHSGKDVTHAQRRSKSLETLSKLEKKSAKKCKTPTSNKKIELNISESLQKSTRRGHPRKSEVEAPSKSSPLIDNETPSILKKISNAVSTGKSSKKSVQSLGRKTRGVEVTLSESQLSSKDDTPMSTRNDSSVHSVGRRSTDKSKSIRRSNSSEIKTRSKPSDKDVQKRSKSLETSKLQKSEKKSANKCQTELNLSDFSQKSTGKRSHPRKGEDEALSKSVSLIINETPSSIKKIPNAPSTGKSSKNSVKSLSRRTNVRIALFGSELSNTDDTPKRTRKNSSMRSVGRKSTDKSKSIKRSKSTEIKSCSRPSGKDVTPVQRRSKSLETLSKLEKKSAKKCQTPISNQIAVLNLSDFSQKSTGKKDRPRKGEVEALSKPVSLIVNETPSSIKKISNALSTGKSVKSLNRRISIEIALSESQLSYTDDTPKSTRKDSSVHSVGKKSTDKLKSIRRSKSVEIKTPSKPSGKDVTPVQRRSKSLEKLTKLEVSKTKSKTPASNKKVKLNISEALQKSTGRRGRPRKGEVEAPSKSVSLIDNETPSILKKISNAASIGKSSKTNVKSLGKRTNGVEVALSESQLSSMDNTSTSTRKNKSLHSPRKSEVEALSKSVSLIDNKIPSNIRKGSNGSSNSKSVNKCDKYINRRSRSLDVSPSTLITIVKSPVSSKRHSSVLDGSGKKSSAKLKNFAVNSPSSKFNLSSGDDSSFIKRRSKSLDALSNIQEKSEKKLSITVSPKPETLQKSTGRSLPKRIKGETFSHSKVRDSSKSPKVTPNSVSLSQRTLTRSSVSKGSQSVKKTLKRKLITGELHDKYSPAVKTPKSDKKKVAAIIKCYGQKSPSYADILKKNLSEKQKNQALVKNISQPSRKDLYLKHSVKSSPERWSLNVPQKFNFTTSTGHVESPETIVIRRKDTPRPVIPKTRKGRKSTFVFVSGKDPNLSGIENLFHTPVKESSLPSFKSVYETEDYYSYSNEGRLSSESPQEEILQALDLTRKCDLPPKPLPGPRRSRRLHPPYRKTPAKLSLSSHGQNSLNETIPSVKKNVSFLKGFERGRTPPNDRTPRSRSSSFSPMKTPKSILKSSKQLQQSSSKGKESLSKKIYLDPRLKSSPTKQINKLDCSLLNLSNKVVENSGNVTLTPKYRSILAEKQDIKPISESSKAIVTMVDKGTHTPDFSSGASSLHDNIISPRKQSPLKMNESEKQSLSSPKTIYTNTFSTKQLFNLPQHMNKLSSLTEKVDYTDVTGVRELFNGQKTSPVANYSNVSGIRDLFSSPDKSKPIKANFNKVVGIRQLFNLPRVMRSAKSRQTSTDLLCFTPQSDMNTSVSENLSGLKELFSRDEESMLNIEKVRKLFLEDGKTLSNNTPPQPKEGAKGSRKRKQKGDSGLQNRVGLEPSTSNDNLSSEIIDPTDEVSSEVKQHRSTRKGKTNDSVGNKIQVSKEEKLKQTEVKEKSPKNVLPNEKIKEKNLRHMDKEAEKNIEPKKIIAVKKSNDDRPVEILDKKTRSGVEKKTSNNKGNKTSDSKTKVMNYQSTIKDGHDIDKSKKTVKNKTIKQSHDDTGAVDTKNIISDESVRGSRRRHQNNSSSNTSKSSKRKLSADKKQMNGQHSVDRRKVKITDKKLDSSPASTSKKSRSRSKKDESQKIKEVKKETELSKISESPAPSRVQKNLRSKLLLQKGEVEPSNDKTMNETRSRKKVTTKEEPAVIERADNQSNKNTETSRSRKRKNVEQNKHGDTSVGKSDEPKKINKTQKKLETEATYRKVVRESRRGKKVSPVKSVTSSPKATRSRSRVDPKPGTSKASGRDKSPKVILKSRSPSVTKKGKTRSHKRPAVSSPIEELPSPKKARVADSKKPKMEASGSKKRKSPRILNLKKPVGTPSPKEPNLSLKKYNSKESQKEVSSPKIKSRTDLKKRTSNTAVKKSTKSPVKRKGKTVSINTGSITSRKLRRRK